MLGSLRNAVRLLVLVAAFSFAMVPGAARAQGAGVPDKEAQTEPGWVAPYFLTGLGIGLGLMSVCRASKRRNPEPVKEVQPA